MKYYTVSDVAEMLSVNEETVRRWIRSNKLDAERGLGRQGSKISAESLKKFLDQNKGLITSRAASMLGLTIGATAAASVAIPGLGLLLPGILGSVMAGAGAALKSKDKNQVRLDLIGKELELEMTAAEIKKDIADKEYELKRIEIEISKIKEILKQYDYEA